MWRRGDEVFAEVTLPADAGVSAAGFGVHPVMLDAALHAVILASDRLPRTAGLDEGSILVPFSWQQVSLHAAGASAVRARIVRRAGPSAVSIELADGLGLPVLSVASMVARPVTDQQLLAAVSSSGPDRLFEVIWSASRRPGCQPASVSLGAQPSWTTPRSSAVLFESAPVAGDVVAEVYAATRAVLAVLQSWLAERDRAERWWWRPGARWRCRARTSPIWRARRCGGWCGRRRPSIPAGSCSSTLTRPWMLKRSQRLWRSVSRRCCCGTGKRLHRAGARQPRRSAVSWCPRMMDRGGWV